MLAADLVACEAIDAPISAVNCRDGCHPINLSMKDLQVARMAIHAAAGVGLLHVHHNGSSNCHNRLPESGRTSNCHGLGEYELAYTRRGVWPGYQVRYSSPADGRPAALLGPASEYHKSTLCLSAPPRVGESQQYNRLHCAYIAMTGRLHLVYHSGAARLQNRQPVSRPVAYKDWHRAMLSKSPCCCHLQKDVKPSASARPCRRRR
jgi:hypothetical protein